MSDSHPGTDRAGRRRKRFLTPAQKYEIWVQLLRGETTIAAAAGQASVGRRTPRPTSPAVSRSTALQRRSWLSTVPGARHEPRRAR
ncbi:MAG: hypothetical protein ACRDYX_08685 [Egibacteraceae bacterium]